MNKKAFSLIELAFVLIIMGIILTGGISIFTLYVKSEKRKQTKDIVKTACEAIKGYAKDKKILPTPTDKNGDGFLELPPDIGIQSKDAYNQFLVYNIASDIDTSDFCQNPIALISLNDKGSRKENVAFIVYSKSENRTDDTDCSQTPSPCSVEDVSYQIRNPDETTDTGKKYDDIVCYIDINVLRENSCPKFEITTSSFPIGTQYLEYPPSSINVVNGTLDSCSYSGDLPKGLDFDESSCTLSGTPEEAGTFNITITATDTIGRKTSKSFTITINPNPVKIETNFLPYAYTGQDYTVALSASGATGSYIWTLESNGGLTDLNLSSDGVLSVSGENLTTAGVYTIKVKVCDEKYNDECSSKQLYLTVLSSSASSGGGGSGGGGGGGGDGGSGGGGGGGGSSSCSSYQVTLINSRYLNNTRIRSVLVDGQCRRSLSSRRRYNWQVNDP
ncbi:MAG TPA: prepilin-type N-terminal cleavage/methylation domain-containing protein, partial [Hydrogenothermaceae bacterium]|nr:prepilin-type N-terminal cleavage/methylation domain-containing protein [Hydrogenothermaceae bacterium]